MFYLLVLALTAVAWYGIHLPKKTDNMTEEEFRAYFCRDILGMK
jgi:hypothetical protein